jgi:hypothetical protein
MSHLKKEVARTVISVAYKAVPLRCDAMSTTWNRTGFRGVERFRDRFRATIGGDHIWRSQYFSTAVEAAKAYDRMARKIHGARGFYNFPRPGERKVEPIDEDFCPHGHARKLHTYFRPDGHVGYCRKCNRLAQERSAARRKARC